MKYIFCVRGLDMTRKSVTGPGCTLTAFRRPETRDKVIVELELDKQTMAEDEFGQTMVSWCANLIAAHTELRARNVSGFVDDLGRCVVYHRGMAIGALIPVNKYAGMLFCPKLK